MDKVTVADIKQYPLSRIPTEGGDVLHALKKEDEGFVSFGEAYFSQVKPGFIKAWKKHTQMSMNLFVPIGQVMFVFIDPAQNIKVAKLGGKNYFRLSIPPMLWFGFKGLSEQDSLVLNIASIKHSEYEVLRKPKDFFSFDWEKIR